MNDDGEVFVDVSHRTPALTFDPGESAWLGHVRDVALITPMLLSQLEGLRVRWDEGRERRRAEREQEAQDYASMMVEEWHGV